MPEDVPECPYNCPYDPSKEERPDYSVETIESEIDGKDVPVCPKEEDDTMATIFRQTDGRAEIHIENVWKTRFETKVGVRSKQEFSYVFSDEMNWDRAHQKWNTERVQDTDMWEIDLDAIFYVAALFNQEENVDVSISDEVLGQYLAEQGEG